MTDLTDGNTFTASLDTSETSHLGALSFCEPSHGVPTVRTEQITSIPFSSVKRSDTSKHSHGPRGRLCFNGYIIHHSSFPTWFRRRLIGIIASLTCAFTQFSRWPYAHVQSKTIEERCENMLILFRAGSPHAILTEPGRRFRLSVASRSFSTLPQRVLRHP